MCNNNCKQEVLSDGDTTNWMNRLFTYAQMITDGTPSYRTNRITDSYNKAFFLKKSELRLEENNRVIKIWNLELIQFSLSITID